MSKLIGLVVVFVSSLALGAGEGDVFARLMARLVDPLESSQLARLVFKNTPEGTAFSRAFLGAQAAADGSDQSLTATVQAMRDRGATDLARKLEERLDSIQQKYIEALGEDPGQDMDALLRRLTTERLGLRQEGEQVHFMDLPGNNLGNAVDQFLGADAERSLGELRAKAVTIAGARPALKINETLAIYDRIAGDATVSRVFSRAKLLNQLVDEEMTYYTQTLHEVLAAFEAEPAELGSQQKLEAALKKVLHGKVPESSIEGRVRDLMNGEHGSFERALGDMNLKEMQTLLHGGNPLAPTPESLLGKYLTETGAASVVRSFPIGPNTPQPGPQRLVVAVSAQSFAAYQRYFTRIDMMSTVAHAQMIQNGRVVSYSQRGEAFRMPSVNNILPQVILKTTEGQRLSQFLDLLARDQNWGGKAMSPWTLQGYCAVGGYTNCTQWIGNIPLGDERMMEYSFPSISNDPAQARVQRLGRYMTDDPLVRRVWKVPGNQQMGEVLGQKTANLSGDFANPGWVITTLLGPTSADRVPVVFLITADHRLPIDPGFVPQFERPF